ncbi:tetratricopeptide repeat protein [Corynebacterium tapiri]|uniref:Tetratricopeptide repeat protein n=1 Tax=Corynebacterium tapiri TaxID=1448266 RepID=A0A5C4U5T0_9CORY|nr:tetratricopeptide repeat protein [Corynebacterium tapiri]TNL99746.1 tetratricopeptide repeat protein [Corynebacterium tapiri]
MTQPPQYAGGAIDLGSLGAQQNSPKESAAGGVSPVVEVTAANFEAEVVRRSTQVPVILIIGSQRSQASNDLHADLTELARAQQTPLSYIVAFADADAVPQIAQAIGVQQLPTTVVLAAGQPITQFVGAQPREALSPWVDQIVNAVAGQLEGLPAEDGEVEQEDQRLIDAALKLEAGEYQAAIALYDEVLAEGHNPEVKQARATAVLLARRGSEQSELFHQADEAVIAGNPEAAFDLLINAVATSAGEEKTAAKDRLIELLGLFDNSDERVKSARTRLASALY